MYKLLQLTHSDIIQYIKLIGEVAMSILKKIRNWVEIDITRTTEKQLQIKLTLQNGPYKTLIWEPTQNGLQEFCRWITLSSWKGIIPIEKFQDSTEDGKTTVAVGIRITNKRKIILRFAPESGSPIEYEFVQKELLTLIEEICAD
jgi:hypothetical protein